MPVPPETFEETDPFGTDPQVGCVGFKVTVNCACVAKESNPKIKSQQPVVMLFFIFFMFVKL